MAGNSVSGMIVGVIIFAAIFVNVIVIFGLLTEEKGTWCAYLFTVEDSIASKQQQQQTYVMCALVCFVWFSCAVCFMAMCAAQ